MPLVQLRQAVLGNAEVMLDFNDPPPSTPAITVALRYAEQGVPVFPCHPATKRPLVETGFKAATTDTFQVRKWWSQFPGAMIGAPTGQATGWWVLDVDTDETKGKQGLQSLASMGHDIEDLMDTAVSRTGSGGYHVLFRFDPEAPVTNARGSLPQHLDVRGEGGYIILAGSQLADGRRYEWLNPPEENDVADAPSWLMDAISGPTKTADIFDFNTATRVAPTVAERVAAAVPGTWHERTRDLVARMVREGASDETIAAIAPQFTEGGFTHQQTVKEFLTHARTAREKWGYQAKPAQADPLAEPEAPKDRKRLPLVSRADLRDREAPDYLIDEVIAEKSVITVYGPSGSLKSFAAIDLGMSVAHGLPWQGRDTKQGSVIYVTGEGTAQIGHRLDAWDIAHDTEGFDAPFHLLPLGVPISDPAWVTALIEDIKEAGIAPVMIWLDTLARTFGQGDENSQKDMNAYVNGIDRLRDTFGCVVGVVHHTGKDGDRGLRGSSALYAAMDTVIRTDRKGNTLTLKNQQPHGKQKDGAEFEDITLDARIVKLKTTDKKGREITSLALFESEGRQPEEDAEDRAEGAYGRPQGANQQAVMKALKQAKGEPLGLTRMLMMTKIEKARFYEATAKLVEKGLVVATGQEGSTRWELA